MNIGLRIAALVVAAAGGACTTVMPMTGFTPYVTKDGIQSFRFVAKDTLPSHFAGQDLRQIHETLISNELGRRQYCMRGYEIVSVTTVGGDNLLYEGICSPQV